MFLIASFDRIEAFSLKNPMFFWFIMDDKIEVIIETENEHKNIIDITILHLDKTINIKII